MFNNIPIDETIDLLKTNNLNNNPNKDHLITALGIITAQNYFTFNNKFYIQEKGLPMGSPLSPILANIYMDHFENNYILSSRFSSYIKYYKRYVDDIILVWTGDKEHISEFLEYVNNIKST
jgi:retron-type reverse transcriptase